jgi:RTX calcium-binding nonapeptide repeat (4 copies)
MSTITTTIHHGVTFGATYVSPLTITTTGAVNNNGTGKAVFGGTETVVNYGHIIATGNSGGYGYQGIYLGGGYVNNHGSITASGNAVVFQGAGRFVNSGFIYGQRWGFNGRSGLQTVTNTGTISGGSQGIVLSGGGLITNSGLIAGADGIGIGGAAGTVDNTGTITSYGAGVALNAGGVVSNAGVGLISVNSNYAAAVYITGGAGSVTNAATLSAYIGVSFVGAYNDTLIDSGTIIGSSGTAVAFATGNDLLKFLPTNSIDIQGTVDGGSGTNTLEFASGASTGTFTGTGVDFLNFTKGTIDANAQWVFAGGNTIGTGTTLTDNGSLSISGTLDNDGSIALGQTALTLIAGSYLRNDATGRITGIAGHSTAFVVPAVVGLTGGASTFANLGTVSDSQFNFGVKLLGGGTVTNGSTSDTSALIYARVPIYIQGGSGTVSNFGTLKSNPTPGGTGAITLTAGGKVINGAPGSTAALISGAYNGVVVNGSAATVTNFGTINAATGTGILLQAGGTIIDAGKIVGGGGTAIQFTGTNNNRLILDPGYSAAGNVIASASATNVLELASGTSIGTLTGLGAEFTDFAQIAVDAGANWTLSGTSTLVAGGALTDNGVLTVGGSLANAGSIVVDPPLYVSGTLVNSSAISAVTGNPVDAAVSVVSGGTLTNTGAGAIVGGIGAAAGPGSRFGITGGGAVDVTGGSVTNQARITGGGGGANASAPTYEGGSGGTGVSLTSGSLINVASGIITGGVGGYDGYGGGSGGSGVVLATGTLSNQGTILGGGGGAGGVRGGAGGAGVVVTSANQVVSNQATISGGNYGTGSPSSGGYGIYFKSGGTLIDAGLVGGGAGSGTFGTADAVRFLGTASDLLILEQGYTLHGAVVGSASASSNALELLGTSAANAVTATYNSLGLTNFGTIAFAAGSSNYATLKVTTTATPPVTITNFTGAHDTIDLSGLAYVSASSSASFNTSSHQLTITNGTNFVTLQLGSGSYAGLGWQVTSDGATGSDVIAGLTVTSYDWIGASADWLTATDWSSGIVPGTTASATIANAGSNTITIGSSESIAVAGVTLSNGNTLDVAGTLAPTGTVSISSALLSVATSGLVTNAGTGVLISGTGVVSNNGTIAGGNLGSHYAIHLAGTVLNGGTITGTSSTGLVGANTIVNLGTISNTVSSGVAVVAYGVTFPSVTNGASGTTTALLDGGHDGIILHGGSSGGTVVNYGTVIGGNFVGIVLQGTSGTLGVSNSGTIISGGSYAVVAVENVPGFATVNNAGVIQGTSGNPYGVVFRADGSVTNSGMIASPGTALAIGNGFTAVVTNSGTLSGSEGFQASGTASQTLLDSGTIIGTSGTAAIFAAGNDLLQLQPSASVAIQGTVDGSSGTNTLELASGAATGTLTGANADFVNFQTLAIDPSASWVIAGSDTFGNGVNLVDNGSLTVTGSVVANIYGPGSGAAPVTVTPTGSVANGGTGSAIYLFTGTVVNYGGIAASGASPSNDGVRLRGAGSLVNHGTITGHYGVLSYGYLTVSNTGVIGTSSSRNGVFLRGGGSVTNSGLITGSAGINGPILSLAVTIKNSGTISGLDGLSFNVADTADATIVDTGTIIGSAGPAVQFGGGDDLLVFQPSTSAFVEGAVDGGTGTNTLEFASAASTGTLTGLGAAFYNFAQGTVDSGASWVLAGSNTFGSSVTLTDSGTLKVAGALTNAGTLTVDPTLIVSGSLINTGSINAPGTYTAISVTNGGILTNTATGIITSGSDAVLASGTVSVTNLGTITASDSTASAVHLTGGGTVVNGSTANTSALLEGYTGVFAQSAAATITNFATIRANPTLNGVGVNLDLGGTLINGALGSTAALIAGGRFGVSDNAGLSTVTNYGTISGADIAMYLVGGGTIINAGTVIGGVSDAILFGVGSTGHNLLVLEHGFAISGNVASVATAANSVELLGTSSALSVTANYNALSLTNFGTIAFATSAPNYATLTISNTATLPGTITNFTGLHDAIDLTTLSYSAGDHTSLNASSHVLNLLDSGGSTLLQLQLGSGSYAGVIWKAQNDGSGHVAITPEAGTPISFDIPDEATLNSVFAQIGVGGSYSATSTDFTLTITDSFTLTSAVSSLTLGSGDSLTFDGSGFTIDGGSAAHNFLNVAAPVTINDLAIVNAQATVVAGESWTLTGSDTIGTGTTLTNSGTVLDNGTLVDAGTIVGPITLSATTALLSVTSSGAVTNTGASPLISGNAATVINYGAISGGSGVAISLTAAGSVLNRGSISSSAAIAVYADTGTVTNLGTISDSTTIGFAVRSVGGVVLNGSSGATSALITSAHFGIYASGSGGSVVNYGTISGNFFGVKVQDSAGTPKIINHGTILSARLALGVYGSGGSVNNLGVIGDATGDTYGVYFRINGSLTNSGLIAGSNGGFRVASRYAAVVNNSGTLGGGLGFDVFGTSASSQTLLDSGTLIGTSGTAANFGAGNDLLQFVPSTSAFVQGTVNGGGGTNTLEFASAATTGTLTGVGAAFYNFAQGTVDSGASWVLAGSDTFGSSVTLTDSGTLVDAGTLTNNGSLLADPPITVTGTLINSNLITGSGGAAVQLAPGAYLLNTGSGTISGDGSNPVVISQVGTASSVVNLGTITNSGTAAGLQFLGNAVVVNGTSGTSSALIAGGTVNTGGDYGISLQGVSNTITNFGTIRGYRAAIYSQTDGETDHIVNGATNDTTALIYGNYNAFYASVGSTGTVTNYGTIDAHFVAGVVVDGAVINGASNDTAALITAHLAGVAMAGTGTDTLVNFGTIKAGTYNSAVDIAPGATDVFANYGHILGDVAMRVGTASNAGTIIGGGFYQAGGTLTNLGTMIALGASGIGAILNGGIGFTNGSSGSSSALISGNTAVRLSSYNAATVTNFATIAGSVGISVFASGTVGQTVIDSGTIFGTGGTAVAFGAGNDRLKFVPGNAYIQGTVSGGGGTNTLEFASGASPGTLTGSNADFVNFANGTLDSGASWVLAGSNTIGSGTTLTDAGTLRNTGTLVLDPPLIVSGTLDNASTITDVGSAPLELNPGAYLLNETTGQITQSAAYSHPVVTGLTGGPSTIRNLGTITNLGAGGGISLQAGGTIIDAGTISGASAIYMGGAGDLLVLEHGFAITGAISASGAGNVVELSGSAGAAVIANYNSLTPTGFSTIEFASGAGNYATLDISNTAALPGTITNFTGAHDIIDLTTLAFVSGSSTATFNTASDQLTVNNGTNSVTLQLGSGSYNGVRFTAVSDGATGTDITVIPSYDWIGGSADWRTATNWSGGVIPGTAANATIANASSNTVTISSSESIQVANLTLSNSDTLLVAGTFAPTGTIGVTGALLSVASGGTVTNFSALAIGGTGTLINAGSVSGNPITLSGASLTNLATGAISSTIYGAVAGSTDSVANQGTISLSAAFAIYMRGTGNVSNAAGALIYGANTALFLDGVNATVTNLGKISAHDSYGISLGHGGLVTNGQAGPGASTAVIEGYFGMLITSTSTAQIGTLLNYGTVIGTGGTYSEGIIIANQGTVINGAGGATAALIEGRQFAVGIGYGVVVNYATISATANTYGSVGVYLHGAGTVNNRGGAALIEGYFGVEARLTSTVANSGTISGNIFGVDLSRGGLVTNGQSGSGTSTALVEGHYAGVVFAGSTSAPMGTLINYGTILGTGLGTTAPGVGLARGGTVVNGPSGATAALIEGTEYGVSSKAGAQVTNYGTISATHNAAGAFGVYVRTAGSVSNLGASSLIDGYVGVYVGGVGTVTNTGTVVSSSNSTNSTVRLAGGGTVIDGGTIIGTGGAGALKFGVSSGAGGSNDLLVLEHGFSISGAITATGTTGNVVELQGSAGAAVTANYNSLGLTNFSTIEFAPGAGNYATLDITNNAILPSTIAGFIGPHDTIDLTTLSDAGNDATTSLNTLTNVLTVTGDSGSVQLQLDSESYTGIVWVAQNDGSGGTAVHPQGLAPPVIAGTQAGQMVNDNATDQPFSAATITDPNGNQSETLTFTLSNGGTATDADGMLSGTGLTQSGTGTYTLSAPNAATATSELEALVFTPTPHQVIPGNSVTTGFKLAVTDGVGQSASDSTTTVLAIAVNDLPTISGTVTGQTVNDDATTQPFATTTISDPDFGATETVTITLTAGGVASDANGMLSGAGLTRTGVGTYTLATGTPAEVTAELQALMFTPTPHEVTPGSSVTTGMTISVTDGIVSVPVTVGGPPTNSATTVIATAVATTPVISGTVANQGVPNQTASMPFGTVIVTDPTFGVTDSAAVALSAPGNGTLSNLSGGSYNPATGLYSFTGTAAAITAALDSLVFTPIAQPNVLVFTTSLALTVQGAGGTANDSTTSVTSVDQILGLAAVPLSQIAISVAPNGTGFAAPVNGDTNEAVVSAPVTGGSYAVPAGFQAMFLGGSANATLSDSSVGNALLVGNQGNDTIAALGANQSIAGGSGTNVLFGFGTSDTIFAEGRNDTIAGGSLPGGVVMNSGSGAAIFAGTGGLTVVDAGMQSTIAGSSGALVATVGVGGGGALVVGGTGSGVVTDVGSNDTVAAGTGAMSVTGSGNNLLAFGGIGGLQFVGAAGSSTVLAAAGGANTVALAGGQVLVAVQPSASVAVSGSSGAATLYGGVSSDVALQNSGGSVLYAAGFGNETLNGAGASAGNQLFGGLDPNGADLIVGGSGNDTLVAGSGADTLVGNGASDLFVFFQANGAAAPQDYVGGYQSNDLVLLAGYGAAAASIAEAGATSSGGNTTITLADNTRITFLGVGSASSLQLASN